MREKLENGIAVVLAGLVVCIPLTTILVLMSYINSIL